MCLQFVITVVSRKYAPSFATLALSTKRGGGGGAYTRDVTISLAITSSLPVKHDLLSVGGGSQARGGEMLSTLAVG